jgi:hypothetical protein
MKRINTQPVRPREGPAAGELTSPALDRAKTARVQLAALATDGLERDCGASITPAADVAPKLYLRRRERVETLLLPREAFAQGSAKTWVTRGIVPVLLTAGGVELVALAFTAARRGHAGWTAAVHVLDGHHHDAWEADIELAGNGRSTLGSWNSAPAASLDPGAIDEITRALNPRVGPRRVPTGRSGRSGAAQRHA